MKKHICIILSIAALLGTLNGCGQKAQTETATTTDTVATTDTTATTDSNSDKKEDTTQTSTDKKDSTDKTSNTTTATKTSKKDNATKTSKKDNASNNATKSNTSTETQNQNSDSQSQVQATNLSSSNTPDEESSPKNGFKIDYTALLPKPAEAAKDLIFENDTKYIDSIASSNRIVYIPNNYTEGDIEAWIYRKYSDVPKEKVYCFYAMSHNPSSNKDTAVFRYIVGQTTKNVYCQPLESGLPMYQIKNNEIVKTFNSLDTTQNNPNWR